MPNTVNANGNGDLDIPPAVWQDISPGIHAPGLPDATGPTTYEIMAFMSVANAETVGNDEVLTWFNFSENIQSLDGFILGTQDQWSAHSYQFNHDAATTAGFWDRLKSRTGFRNTQE
ncbi:MAG: hypothetical protein AAGA30_02380 [Planctomycetota bacterium]